MTTKHSAVLHHLQLCQHLTVLVTTPELSLSQLPLVQVPLFDSSSVSFDASISPVDRYGSVFQCKGLITSSLYLPHPYLCHSKMHSTAPTPLERSTPKLPRAHSSSNTVNKTELNLLLFFSPPEPLAPGTKTYLSFKTPLKLLPTCILSTTKKLWDKIYILTDLLLQKKHIYHILL